MDHFVIEEDLVSQEGHVFHKYMLSASRHSIIYTCHISTEYKAEFQPPDI